MAFLLLLGRHSFGCVSLHRRRPCSLTRVYYSPDVEVKYVGGKDPEMLFRNDNGEVVKVRRHVMGVNIAA